MIDGFSLFLYVWNFSSAFINSTKLKLIYHELIQQNKASTSLLLTVFFFFFFFFVGLLSLCKILKFSHAYGRQ